MLTSIIYTQWIGVAIKQVNQADYFSLTDIAKYKNHEFPADVVKNRLRNKNTIAFLGIWEKLYNPNFKLVEFDQFKNEAWYNSFVLSPEKWIDKTKAIGLITIHTDAIKENLIPKELSKEEISMIYASEADILNKVLFGKTASEWTIENPEKVWNIRDYATIEQLVVLSNMESINALLIWRWLSQSRRIEELSKTAISQMKSLTDNKSLAKLTRKM